MIRLQQILAPAEVLLGTDALAHVVTTNPSGTAQVSVVWCGVVGDQIVFCTRARTAKVRNLRRDPQIVLSIQDETRSVAGRERHLVVYGRARVVDSVSRSLCDRLCRTYLGTADHPSNLRRHADAVTVEVEIDRIGGNGWWDTSEL